MNKLFDFLQTKKRFVRILIIFLLAVIVALLALNANTNLMPFIYMIF